MARKRALVAGKTGGDSIEGMGAAGEGQSEDSFDIQETT